MVLPSPSHRIAASSRPSRVIPVVFAAVVLALPAVDASAQQAAPPPAPVASSLTLSTDRAPRGEALRGDRWRAAVYLDRYVAGTSIDVSFTAGDDVVSTTVPLAPQRGSARGYARVTVPASMRRKSRVVVRAAVPPGQPVAAVRARTKVVRQASPNVGPGERGLAARILQRMLAARSYATGDGGSYDAPTQRAVLAFRKVAGMAATSEADSAVFRALEAGKGRYAVRYPDHGRHVEIDVDRRVLVEVDGRKVLRIYHTSPGKPSTPTVRGSFRVYRKDPGTNALGMYKASYFIRGYAVHGYPEVPAGYSASHGCARVPMADADAIYAFMTMGMRVDAY